jgi:hypothetical protein
VFARAQVKYDPCNVLRSISILGSRRVLYKLIADVRWDHLPQRLIQMKMNDLITDDEYRTERCLLDERLNDGVASPSVRAQEFSSVLSDLDLIERPLQDLAGFWDSQKIEIRKRFQRIILPEGYVVTRIGTAPKAGILSFFEGSLPLNPTEVASDGQTWNQLTKEIIAFAEIMRDRSLN